MGGILGGAPPTPQPLPPPPPTVVTPATKVQKATDLTKGTTTEAVEGTSSRRKARKATPSLVTLDGSTSNPSILGN